MASPKIDVNEFHITERDLDFSINSLDIEIMWIAVVPDHKVWSYNKHKDTGFEFHIIPKGMCTLTIEDQEPQKVYENQLFIIPPGVYHAQQSCQDNPAIEYGLHCHIAVDYDKVDETQEEAYFLEELLQSREVSIVDDIFRVRDTFNHLLHEGKKRYFGYHSKMKTLIYMIILNSLRAVAISKGLKTSMIKPNINEVRMNKIDKIINKNLDKNITLKELSNMLYLSKRQINRVVMETRGHTYRQYLLHVKLQKARVWLADPNLKIYEIAEKLGFSSSHHFSQAFKNKHGFLPSEFRDTINLN